MEKSHNQRVGKVGEDIASEYLEKKGFTVLDRNYSKKWGELDIIAKKDSVLHFVEVKTRTCDALEDIAQIQASGYLPEERVTPHKQERLRRAIESYLMEKKVPDTQPITVAVIAIYYVPSEKSARVRMIENIIL